MGAGWEKAVWQQETRLWVSFKEKNLVLCIIRFLIRFIYFIYLLSSSDDISDDIQQVH